MPSAARGPLVVGQRPEDLQLCAPGSGNFTGEVFSSELLGDATLVGVKLGPDLVTVKVGPAEGRPIGEPVGVALDPARLHLFDAASGLRLGQDAPQ